MTNTGVSSSGPKLEDSVGILRGATMPEPRSGPRPLEELGARVLADLVGLHGLERLTPGVGQTLRHDDLNLGQEVTALVAPLHATTLDPQHATARGARRDLHADRRPVQGRHRHRRAERGLREGDRQVDGEVVAVPAEHRVLLDGDREDQVAGLGTGVTASTLAAQPDLLPVAYAGRDPRGDALAVGRLEGHGLTGHGVAERQVRPGLHIGSLAWSAGGAERVVPAVGRPTRVGATGLPEEVGEQVLHVGVVRRAVARRVAGAGVTAAEHAGEDVLEAAGRPAAPGGEPGAAARHGAELVVLLALLGVGEDGVRLADLLELGLGGRVPGVLVRVQLPGQLAVGLLDRRRVGVGGDAEDGVEVLVQPVLASHLGVPPLGSVCERSLRVGDRDPCGSHDPLSHLEPRLDHLDDGGRRGVLGKLGLHVHQGLVDGRIELLALGADPLDAEPSEDPVQLVGDRRERRAVEVAVLARGVDVVEDRQQRLDDLGDPPVAREVAVAVDALLVVDVLRLEAAQVLEMLGRLAGVRVDVRGGRLLDDLTLDLVVHQGSWRVGDVDVVLVLAARLRRGVATVRALAGPAGGLVPAAAGTAARRAGGSGRLLADRPHRLVRHLRSCGPSVSSSTISASTTSSAAESCGPASPEPAEASAAALAAYMACPIFWETSLSFAVLALMSSTSVPGASLLPTAVFSSARAASTSDFSAAGTFSPFSARNFSVE